MKKSQPETNSSNEADGLSKFIRFVYKNYPKIKSYSSLQAHLEAVFERDFEPEND